MRSGFQEVANVPAPFDQHSHPVVDVEGRTTGEEAKTQYLSKQNAIVVIAAELIHRSLLATESPA
jgi:hypothetical protein